MVNRGVSMDLNRKYRPKTFSEVVGHGDKKEMLKGFVRSGNIPSSFLFSGIRGIGKTTLARIFAKAMNCRDIGTDGDPCDKCESCVAINNNTSYSVIEIDGASNRGIDDMRKLKQLANFKVIDKYKVFIIDEAHVLTKEAFQAGLKLLEEAPKDVVFILVSTDKGRILETILSRAIEIQLLPLSVTLVRNRLRQLCEWEKLTISSMVIDKIAEDSHGILRDAVNQVEQLGVMGKDVDIGDYRVMKPDVELLDAEFKVQVCKAFMASKITDLSVVINKAIEKGINLKGLLKVIYDGVVGSYIHSKLKFYPGYMEGIEVSEKDCKVFLEIFPMWYRLISDYTWDYDNIMRMYYEFMIRRSI